MMPMLVAVCVPKGGHWNLRKLYDHIDDCACRKRRPLYTIECFSYAFVQAVGHTSDAIAARALDCAAAALVKFPEAILGVGIECGQIVFKHGGRPIITPIAAAALIMRKNPLAPQIVMTAHNDQPRYAGDLLELCEKEGFRRFSQTRPAVDALVRQAI